jgi:hypothetical protein
VCSVPIQKNWRRVRFGVDCRSIGGSFSLKGPTSALFQSAEFGRPHQSGSPGPEPGTSSSAGTLVRSQGPGINSLGRFAVGVRRLAHKYRNAAP